MKNCRIVLLLVAGLMVTISTMAQERHFGVKIDEQGAIAMQDLVKQMQGKEVLETKVQGKVVAVCQTKGCWMTLDKGDGSTMRVSFTDYGYFVPKDIAGSIVVIQGRAKVITTSVDELRHYAQDAGKSKEEIAKITEPETDLVFEADGVIIK